MSHENIIVSTGKEKITLKIIKTSSFRHKDFVLIHFNFFSILVDLCSLRLRHQTTLIKELFLCNSFSKVALIFSLLLTIYYGTFASLTREQT